MFQQDLNDANVTVPGCTVERSQLILRRDALRQGSSVFSDVRDKRGGGEDRGEENAKELNAKERQRYVTLVLASICAPLSSSSLTIITLPLLEAICRGVMPF